jgi:hypothetical protein
MKLNELNPLFQSMKNACIDRYQFEYQHGKGLFDVFFFTDESPFVLLFGARGTQFCFEVFVYPGFEISTKMSSQDYRELCNFLELKFDPENPFSPFAFFSQFNKNIPHNIDVKRRILQTYEIAQYRCEIEDKNKVYFCGWRNNKLRNETVTHSNLRKTKMLLGNHAYIVCKEKNISSCWTDKSTLSINYDTHILE